MSKYHVVHAVEPSMLNRTYCGRALASVTVHGPATIVANRMDACIGCLEAMKRHADVKQKRSA